MRVLVTGGAGFLGAHLTEALLKEGHDVTVVDDFSTGTEKNLEAALKIASQNKRQLEIHKGCLSLSTTWKNLPASQAVVHAAGRCSHRDDPTADFRSNVAPLPHLVEWLRRHQVHNVVYLNAGDALYGEAIAYPCDERSLVSPQNPSAATRAFGEIYLAATAHALKASSEWSSEPKAANYFSWISLRLATVYGARQPSLGTSTVVSESLRELSRGQVPALGGDGRKTRDYIHVDDVTKAVLMAVKRLQDSCFDDFFNVGSGVETRDDEMLQLVHETVRTLKAEATFQKTLANCPDILNSRLVPAVAGEPARSVMNIGKIDAFLGWLPSIDLEDGVRKTARDFAETL